MGNFKHFLINKNFNQFYMTVLFVTLNNFFKITITLTKMVFSFSFYISMHFNEIHPPITNMAKVLSCLQR